LLPDGPIDELAEETVDPRRHARADLVLSAVLALIAVVYGVQAFDLPQTSPNQADIGPRAYPLLILVLLVLVTALLALKALRALIVSPRPDSTSDTQSHIDRRATLLRLGFLTLVVVSTVVYLELMIPLGFIVSTALFVALQVAMIGGWRRHGGRRVLIPIVFACLTSVAIYVLFADSLGVLLPRGIFSL
jgi:putative tricarboxylic transport membrane protein